MPGTALFIKVLSVIMQYGMLICLLYFISRITRYIWKDVKQTAKTIKAPEAAQSEAIISVVDAEGTSLQGKRFAFSQEITMGRGNDNDIVISDTYVSHHHAVISQSKNLYIIEDLGSVNHTYLNDEILNGRAYLKNGDMIRIGLVTMRFER